MGKIYVIEIMGVEMWRNDEYAGPISKAEKGLCVLLSIMLFPFLVIWWLGVKLCEVLGNLIEQRTIETKEYNPFRHQIR